MAIGTCGVFGDDHRYGPAGAAFLNGALAHSLDFDDTHAAASLHPGAPVIPAALAAGEMVGASGADVLAAIVAGYEITCRVALALPARPITTAVSTRPRPAARLVPPLPPPASSAWALTASKAPSAPCLPVRRQSGVPGQRRLDQALPGRLGRHQRPRCRHPGSRGL